MDLYCRSINLYVLGSFFYLVFSKQRYLKQGAQVYPVAGMGTGEVISGQKVVKTVDQTLKFGKDDIVYGKYDNPSIIKLQQSAYENY